MSTLLNPKFIRLFCLLTWLLAANHGIASAQTQTPPYNVKIIVDTAKMRSGPGTNFPSDGYAEKGDILTVYQISPAGDWLLVQQKPDLWVSVMQVEAENTTSPVSTRPAPTPQTSLNNKPTITPQNVSIPDLLPFTLIFAPYFIVWGVVLLIPLVFGFHWRWSIGSFVAPFFWGPLGLLFAAYVAVLVIFRSNKISTYSPRELMEEFAGNTLFMIFVGLLLIVLTAISILGGVIVIALIYFYFRFSLLFMPGGREQQASYLGTGSSIIPATSPRSTYSPSYDDDYSGSDYSSRDDDYSSNDYTSYDDNYSSRGYDDDKDDDDKGSAWDGWLVKW